MRVIQVVETVVLKESSSNCTVCYDEYVLQPWKANEN